MSSIWLIFTMELILKREKVPLVQHIFQLSFTAQLWFNDNYHQDDGPRTCSIWNVEDLCNKNWSELRRKKRTRYFIGETGGEGTMEFDTNCKLIANWKIIWQGFQLKKWAREWVSHVVLNFRLEDKLPIHF